MNGDYYDLRGKIVSKERRISALTERLEMRAQYQKYKPVRQKLDKVAPLRIGHVGYHRSCSSLRWVWPSLARRSAVFFKVSTALMSSRISRIFK